MQAFKNVRIYTADAKHKSYLSGTIVWDKGRIVALGNNDDVVIPPQATITDGKNRMAILPGFVDVHSHSSLLKGFSEDLNFLDWLPEYQREHFVLNEKDAYCAFMISYLEALKGGTTCVLDMYRFMHQGAIAGENLGLRVNLAPYVADVADGNAFESIDDNEKLIKKYHNTRGGKTRILVGLEHLFYCSEALYKRALHLSKDYGVFIHTHTSEFGPEVEAVKKHFSQKPVHALQKRGVMTPQTILAHCTYLDDDELQILRDNDVRISHCPTSNAKLGGGTMPLKTRQHYGIKVGLGTDGSISNNSLSMFETVKFGSLLQKNHYTDARELNAFQALRLATYDGACVLGLENDIGSLEVGKSADFMTIDLWKPHLMPVLHTEEHDPVLWNIIYAGRASDVQHVWVGGEQVVSHGKSTLVDEDALLEEVHKQTLSLLERRHKIPSKNFIAPK